MIIDFNNGQLVNFNPGEYVAFAIVCLDRINVAKKQ